MNNTKTIVTLLGAALLGTVVINPIVYKTIGISEEAKNKVINYASEWNMTQQDTVSKIVMEYGSTTPKNDWQFWHEDWKRTYAEWKLRNGF